MNEIWLALLVGFPAVMSLAVAASGRWPNLRETVSIATSIALFAGVASFIGPVTAGARPSVTLLEVLPGIGLTFTLEPLGLLFALVASGLWSLTTLYAAGYMRGNEEHAQTRFFVCFALAISAAIGIAFAGNLLTLFIFYEMLTLSTYPLVTHHGDTESRNGGRVYLGILLTTSIGFFLPAIIITYLVSGSITFTAGGLFGNAGLSVLGAGALYVLFLYGTGKAALMPFHRWLPAAMVAPTPVSALLHAVAVVKAGVFIVLKLTVYVFGVDYLAETGASQLMMWVAAVTVLGASLIAMTRDNLKARLAYSTVSQLSYIVLGATMASSLGILGGGMHIAMHAFAKITLFFCAGAIYTATHRKYVSELDGLGYAMPITFSAFFIASLSLVGIPPMGGIWSKWYLMEGAADAGQSALIVVLAISSLLNIVYLLEIPTRAFFHNPRPDTPRRWQEAPWACVIPLSITAAGSIVWFLYPLPFLQLLAPWAPQ
ncbi:monovalent cation/H+ antiporter subunit D family protein [Endozoicomonas sp. G2_2]|uniref:monovalent cation/H+ antiporter subunit D family protein n=1 Tax=Endozoicomonas sp. G2_2 TaxID=2821092 RepID=UPI001ADA0066|nr:monovalent cation/H+ antiporter subunit D family protein [Endozoicomonas sp. G2_2]MBO9470973.1 monovalent cation/H+ antiporter subunit D family protein [Endozoicomonas sp. G2_2]